VAVSVAEIVTEVIEAAVEAMAEAEEVAIVVAEAAVIPEVKVMTRDVIKKISWLWPKGEICKIQIITSKYYMSIHIIKTPEYIFIYVNNKICYVRSDN